MKILKSFIKKFEVIFVIAIYLIITRFTCLIKYITGFPCPACGLTRAYKALLYLNFSEAWNYNPLYWFIPPTVLFIIAAEKPLFNSKKKQTLFFVFVFTIIISVYIYRMILLFPDTPPMDYNKNSLLYKLYVRFRYLIS